MKLTTNIVLTGDYGRTEPYVVKLIPGSVGSEKAYKYIRQDDETWPGEHAMIFDSSLESILSRKGNEWYNEENLDGKTYNIKTSTLRLYFPQYSADTFDQNCIYILGASIFIKGIEIELGCFKFQRKNSLACPPKRFDGMNEYLEYMDFLIPDPNSLYLDALDFLPTNTADDAARLYLSLYIVSPLSNKYIKKDEWTGGQNNISFNTEQNLKLNIKYNNWTNELIMKLKYNYNIGGLISEYLKNVYYINIQNSVIKWDFVVMDDEDIFYYFPGRTTVYHLYDSFDNSFNKTFHPIMYEMMSGDFNLDYNDDFNVSSECVFIKLDILKNYDNGENPFFGTLNNWKPGLFIRGSASIYDYGSGNKTPYINIVSNKIPLTQDLFVKIMDHHNFPSQINLDDLNMNNININAINKIENVTQNVTYKVESQKNHMIQPVFYQTREISQIGIHPAVTENLSLNLETYKPYVKRFLLQIEGVSFKEIGRTSQGIVFKIVGNMLPKSVNEGTAYVLDQDMNLVTTGKYKYIF